MELDNQRELRELVSVIFDLRVPDRTSSKFQVTRPESLSIVDLGWLENVVDAIVEEMQANFDLRSKTSNDDLKEIEVWRKPLYPDGRVERRKNFRLRIRTMVDDLFEEVCPLPDVTATMRAWKIQLTDACADAIIDRFHLRPASSGPWAWYRKTMYELSQELHQALAHRDLFLMTGRISEAADMRDVLQGAYDACNRLVNDLEQHSFDS